MPSETIAIASDHAGFELKSLLVGTLGERGCPVLDLGTDGTDPVDYPDYADAMNEALATGRAARGVLVCGSVIGISIAAIRHPRIRAALVHDTLGARQCREHNDANVICFGGRTIEAEVARDCLRVFLGTEFEGGRHVPRVSKLAAVPPA